MKLWIYKKHLIFCPYGQVFGVAIVCIVKKIYLVTLTFDCHCKHIFMMNILTNATQSTQASKLIEYILPLHDDRFVFNWVWPVSINAKWLYNFNPVGIG